MKKLIILIILIVIAMLLTTSAQKQNKTYTGGNTLFPSLPGSNSTMPPLATRQQCSNDANMLMTRLNQENESNVKQQQFTGHTGQVTYHLSESLFASKLNSCVAIVEENGVIDDKRVSAEYIYDTVSGVLLAQKDLIDSADNFIPLKNPATYTDYAQYRIDFGL